MSLDFWLKYEEDGHKIEVFWINITHNLNKMADKAGIYKALWQPNENGYEKAGEIIKILENGLKLLKNNPEYFKKFNASNGWGLYEHFIPFVEKVLNACKEYPNSLITISR